MRVATVQGPVLGAAARRLPHASLSVDCVPPGTIVALTATDSTTRAAFEDVLGVVNDTIAGAAPPDLDSLLRGASKAALAAGVRLDKEGKIFDLLSGLYKRVVALHEDVAPPHRLEPFAALGTAAGSVHHLLVLQGEPAGTDKELAALGLLETFTGLVAGHTGSKALKALNLAIFVTARGVELWGLFHEEAAVTDVPSPELTPRVALMARDG